jgi:hypothetical protein
VDTALEEGKTVKLALLPVLANQHSLEAVSKSEQIRAA